jgi:hypothetical protein
VAADSNVQIGDTLTVGTGGRKELSTITGVGSAGAGGTGLDLAAPLKIDHMSGVNVSDVGTGITFSPATRYPHLSGDAVQSLGSGITLDMPLLSAHEYGAAVVNPLAKAGSYLGPLAPNQWFGNPLSPSAGSLALFDPSGKVIVDAIVFGSRQSSSSANGTITSPEIAVLEGNQGGGGCIVVAPSAGRGAPTIGVTNRSVGLSADGADTDNNCTDFQLQTPTPGAPNQKSQ